MKGKDLIALFAGWEDSEIDVSNRDGMTCLYGVSHGWRPYSCEDPYFGIDDYFEKHAIVLGDQEYQDEHGIYKLPIKAGDFNLTTEEGLECLFGDDDDPLVECVSTKDGQEVRSFLGEPRLARLYKCSVISTK